MLECRMRKDDEFDYSIFEEENATLFRRPSRRKRRKITITEEEIISENPDFIDDMDDIDIEEVSSESGLFAPEDDGD